jgi:hypothetical protein
MAGRSGVMNPSWNPSTAVASTREMLTSCIGERDLSALKATGNTALKEWIPGYAAPRRVASAALD